ncbi:MAG: hypothetical protein IIX15_02295 [Clostridia bacterium]|nr:hypothetical protein [Clostridia bacterium]
MQQNEKSQSSPIMGAPFDERPLPQGLLMALSQNMQAMRQYAALDDTARQRLIERAANTHSREQMQALVDHMTEFL